MAEFAAADGKLDNTYPDGVGKPSDDQPKGGSDTMRGQIGACCAQTAAYGGHGQVHPATGSPMPVTGGDDGDAYESSVEDQQE